MIKEMTLKEMRDDYNWAEVFADESSGNTDKTTDRCPPTSDVDCTPPSRADVKKVIGLVNGEKDGEDWVGVFELKDGRFLLAYGGCDYTGWDCRASNHLEVANTLGDLLQYGLDESMKRRLQA